MYHSTLGSKVITKRKIRRGGGARALRSALSWLLQESRFVRELDLFLQIRPGCVPVERRRRPRAAKRPNLACIQSTVCTGIGALPSDSAGVCTGREEAAAACCEAYGRHRGRVLVECRQEMVPAGFSTQEQILYINVQRFRGGLYGS